ncbi:MAG TPA: Nif3-like dinuclear metal center hexameric protein [Candidatus Limiplasma sp.]|nr:Nif3-like dinuclear metal center hexameric protein [Candidatus Limiplasma sp.]HRX08621.1 Nif3-like dinuclear metal center hexameric protein [Candidatus Limiplasma sp.]
MKVGQIIDGIIAKTGVPRLPEDKTCDRLMAGSLDNEVTKIVSTFMATVDVIVAAAKAGANFIITHEPTWFTGMDDTSWLQDDPVYLKKKELIEATGMNIWRFHDHMHFDAEDGIFRGFDLEAEWGEYHMPVDTNSPFYRKGKDKDFCYQIPKTTLKGLVDYFKDKFEMPFIRIIGNPDMPVERVAVLLGGGSLGLGNEHMPMELMQNRNLDAILCGETTEWTLPAYVRDAAQLGMDKAILVLGHERSEEPGMKHLGSWLKSIVGDIPVLYIPSNEPFTTL